ncbi:hypothetical protein D0868_01925 [Hortaea werneckii]|uniref:Glycosyl hydrolase family 13 catalytic domain-containing protein n=1 Tax=Hortaea werneckii TaxID=91943 RepID=A0A3M6ZE71_HORWE|nr:hypothetical protein D0868_01925 [Hortaea werneckii]
MGYDISDYKMIDPRYGTLQDVDCLIAVLKEHDMKLLMDLVVTHTSDQHSWFLESASGKASVKRDWYFWRPAKGYDKAGNPLPPNNWAQILSDSQSAWVWHEAFSEFFLALHSPQQPDLNWDNPAVVEAVHDVMHFWLSRGVSGFRMDVINLISKDLSFPDAPETEPGSLYQPGEMFYTNGPRFHDFMRGIYDNVLSKYDTMTVGEMPYVTDIAEISRTVGAEAKELNMMFNFDHMEIEDVKTKGESKWSLREWKLTELKRIISGWQKKMIEHDCWSALFLECHDQARSVSRFVDDGDSSRVQGAKLLALLQTTLGGTVYLYQGEEIGMRNFPSTWDADIDYKDIESRNFWRKIKTIHPAGSPYIEQARTLLQKKARDHARTPMQWTDEPNAGFAMPSVKPWMRVNDDFVAINVRAQIETDNKDHSNLSVWQFWRLALLHRKRHRDAFVYGGFEDVDCENPSIYAYVRKGVRGASNWLVVLNWTGQPQRWTVAEGITVDRVVMSTLHAREPAQGTRTIELTAWEGILCLCK